MNDKSALETIKRVLDDVPDRIHAELWVDANTTLGAFVDMSLAALSHADHGGVKVSEKMLKAARAVADEANIRMSPMTLHKMLTAALTQAPAPTLTGEVEKEDAQTKMYPTEDALMAAREVMELAGYYSPPSEIWNRAFAAMIEEMSEKS